MLRPLLLSLLALSLASACGLKAPLDPLASAERPALQPPSWPPSDPQALASLYREVLATYQGVMTLTAAYDQRQSKGDERYTAQVRMTFAKPRKVRLDVTACSDPLISGARIVWLGGPTLQGVKSIGPLALRQEHRLADKPSLRGWLLSQTDYDAMVQSLLQGLAGGRLLGNATIGGQSLVMVEVPSRLKGVAIERIGIDPTQRLPVYRELRESAAGAPVFVTRYTSLAANPTLEPDAFNL